MLIAMEYVRRARKRPNAITAAGIRVSPTMDRDQLRAIATLKQGWQRIAWNYRDLIGELRFALKFRARCMSRVQFYVAEVQQGTDDEPIAVEIRNDKDAEKASRVTLPDQLCADAEEALASLPVDHGGEFLETWSENFDVAGECWLHGFTDSTGTIQWLIRSVDEIEVSADGSQVWLTDPTSPSGKRKLDLGEESGQELYRMWVPHPRNRSLADSALRACLDSLEDIVLGGREMRAAARSRIASNGAWLLPYNMFLANGTTAEDGDAVSTNKFAADLTAALLAPITNEGDAGAMAPVILVGRREDIDVAKDSHVRFDREDSALLIEKIKFSLSRMASSIDVPPEIINGMAEVNHWTAWQIDASTAKHYIEPGARLIADAITTSYLRPILLSLGHAPEDVARIRVWFSLGSLTENPNRRQDALDAADRGAISLQALRKALGFNEEDEPSPSEMLTMVAMKQGVDAAWAARVLAWWAEQEEGGPLEGLPMPPQETTGQIAPAGDRQPGQSAGTGRVPSTAPSAIAAAGNVPSGLSGATSETVQTGRHRSAYRLVHNEFVRMMDVERTLRDGLLAACDEAVNDAVRRAGSRVRGKVSANRDLSLAVKEIPSSQLCAHLGREQTLALADLPFLLNDAFTGLRDKFVSMVTFGIDEIVARVLRVLGLKQGDRRADAIARTLSNAMTERINDGWSYLESAVRARAERLLFGDGGEPDDEVGEISTALVKPAVVRASLSIVGGLPAVAGGVDERGRSISGEPLGGLSNGETVRDELERSGGHNLGYTWVYGITPLLRKFEPHWDLEGKRFENWRDERLFSGDAYGGRYAFVGPFFHPGDHDGCMCDYVPAWALPAYGAQVDELLRTPTSAMAAIIALAEDDDRAGRTGTTAQAERERWQEVQALQARFIKGEAA